MLEESPHQQHTINKNKTTRIHNVQDPGLDNITAAEHLESALKIQSTIMTDEPSDELLRTWLDEELLRNKEKSLFISTVSFRPEIDALITTGHSFYGPATRLQPILND